MSTTHFLFFKEIPVQNLSSQNGHHQWTTNQDSFFSDQNNRLAFTCMGISPRGKTTLKAFWKVLFLFLRISRMNEILLFYILFLKAADKYPYFPGQEPTLPGNVDFLLEVCLLFNLYVFFCLCICCFYFMIFWW